MTSSDRLSEIRKRREAATPGPWTMTTQGGVESVHYRGPGEDFTSVAATRTYGDWDFIAKAPADIDWLIEQHERLTDDNEFLRLTVREQSTVQQRHGTGMDVRRDALAVEVTALRSKLAEVREYASRPASHRPGDEDRLPEFYRQRVLAILDREEQGQ